MAIAFRIIGNLSISLSLLYCFQESVLITLIVDSQGWALRAGEAILRGTFVCEYIGEVLDEEKANKRRHRFLISSDRYSLRLLLSCYIYWMDPCGIFQVWEWRLQLSVWNWCSYQWYEQIDWRTGPTCDWCYNIWKCFTVHQSQVRKEFLNGFFS